MAIQKVLNRTSADVQAHDEPSRGPMEPRRPYTIYHNSSWLYRVGREAKWRQSASPYRSQHKGQAHYAKVLGYSVREARFYQEVMRHGPSHFGLLQGKG